MANPEHLAKLKEGVAAWNEWRKESQRSWLGPRGPDLSGVDLSRENLQWADLSGADLRDADLSKAELRMADLGMARLSKANLSDANIHFANLSAAMFNRGTGIITVSAPGVDLSGANLSRAELFGANLSRALLSHADLRGAHLSEANLYEAQLSGANLSEAIARRMLWAKVDLSETVGLESIKHEGPSTVGIDTLVISKGRIPDVFLRGCGLADWEIENAKLYNPDLSEDEITTIQYRVHNLRVAKPIRFYSVFISYSHEDKAFAHALHDALQASGIRCWLDEKQLLPGDDIHERIDHGIRHWDKVILCASKNSLTSWWVDRELTTAFDKEARIMKERGKKVLALMPLNLDGFLFKWENGKATEVRARFAPDFTAWSAEGFDFPKAIEPLIKALRADDGGREPIPAPQL